MNWSYHSTMRRILCPPHRFFLFLSFWVGCGWVSIAASLDNGRFLEIIVDLQTAELSTAASKLSRDQLAACYRAALDTTNGLTALYLLGRLRQLEDDVNVPDELVQLSHEHAAHPLGQLAALKILLRRLYAIGPESVHSRLRAGEELSAVFMSPALRSDYHVAMGDAYIFHGDRQMEALRHFRAAIDIGIPISATRANVLVQIGELARLTGESAIAADSYRAFITEFPRDLRQQIVRDRLAEVEDSLQ